MIYLYGDYYVSHSYGVKCMYDMIKRLNELGYESKVLCFNDVPEDVLTNFPIPAIYKDIFINYKDVKKIKLKNDDIVIYPESQIGNPLRAKNVVRWLLNRAFFLSGTPIEYGEKDIVLSYSHYIRDDIPQLFYIIDEREFFNDIRKKYVKHNSDTVSVYFGKVHLSVIEEQKKVLKDLLENYSKVNVLTRKYPLNRTDTLKLIGESDLLISFDGLTNTNFEALLLGTPVLILDDPFEIKEKKYNIDDSGYSFSIDELKNARQVAKKDLAFKSYCEWLEKQDCVLKETIDNVLIELKNFKTKNECVKENIKLHNRLLKEDKQLYNEFCNAEPFISILQYRNIPSSIGKIVFTKEEYKNIYDKRAIRAEHIRRIINFCIKILKPIGLYYVVRPFYRLFIKSIHFMQRQKNLFLKSFSEVDCKDNFIITQMSPDCIVAKTNGYFAFSFYKEEPGNTILVTLDGRVVYKVPNYSKGSISGGTFIPVKKGVEIKLICDGSQFLILHRGFIAKR